MGKTADYKRIVEGNLASIFSFINLGFIQGSNALIQLLLIPVVFRIVGIEEFGHIGVAAAFAGVLGLFINYGSNQSGIKDVALNKFHPEALARSFYTIFVTRAILFILSALVLWLVNSYGFTNGKYFIPAMTIVLAETLNPYFFFVGVQRLLLYNLINLVSKIISAVLIILLVTSPAKSEWVNFYIGLPGAIGYAGLCLFIIKKYSLGKYQFSRTVLWKYLRNNFYLTGNNLSVQLQQSLFLFTISATSDSLLLGAYSLCDKIVWSFRLLLIAFSNAIYPKATQVYHANKERWQVYKRKINLFLFIAFMCVAVILFAFSPMIVLIITGGANPLAISFVRAVCFVPLVAALNSLNVIDLLMKNKYHYIFIIALLLLAISIISSQLIIRLKDHSLFGYYPIIVEIFSLPLYLYFIRKKE